MKKSLALLAVATLLLSASGCGCCRGLFGRSSVGTAGPFYGRLAPSCAPACAPTCDTSCGQSCGTMCSAGAPCDTGPSCGCESGTPISYGYDGSGYAGSSEIPMSGGIGYESTPMSFPTGSGTFGQ